MTTYVKRITLLSTGLILTGLLTACNSTVKPDCWKATHNTINKDCNSGGGGVSVKRPSIKDKIGKKDVPSVDAPSKDIPSKDTPSVDTPTNDTTPEAPNDTPTNDTTPEDNSSNDTEPEDTTQDDTDQQQDTPLQSNSHDVKGFDPFGGLYGPGT